MKIGDRVRGHMASDEKAWNEGTVSAIAGETAVVRWDSGETTERPSADLMQIAHTMP